VSETQDDDEVTCLVCSDTVPRGKARSLVCRHMFCEACFSGWVCAELEKGPQCLHARCPMHKCPLPLPPSLFLELLPDAKARRRYKMFIISNLLERSHEVHACPFAECSISAYSRSQSLVTVFCGCGNEWCFACRHEDHRPVSCRQAEEWEAKRSSEHSNVSWIKAHTKAVSSARAPRDAASSRAPPLPLAVSQVLRADREESGLQPQ
jgi:ariadne-1